MMIIRRWVLNETFAKYYYTKASSIVMMSMEFAGSLHPRTSFADWTFGGNLRLYWGAGALVRRDARSILCPELFS
jgi:hypothetical protein